ncbi:cytochrome c oxidase accessory protein CcoG [bacterium]|nr:cytochrome c oxidase accessory protein CcoG [bacterium]
MIADEKKIQKNGEKDQDNFRDSISIIDKSGKRVWVYPKKPKGKYHSWRILVSAVLLAVLFGVPFIKIDGHPFFLLNIIERKFIIFGMAFWPQDFYIFALVFLSLVIFIFLFTTVFGRIWCGWACPQTIFMEMVFRKIEYWIEGDGAEQYKLDRAEMSPDKLLKKTSKHVIFFSISFVIGNTFLAYIIGVDDLFKIITEPVLEHIVGFSFMIGFSLLFYFIFASFREQACIYVCPYGRLQSVMLDKNSIVVAYDFKRGEPRGKLKYAAENQSGDCIDCGLCVQVCPTGIDIRNGTQLECVNCTACMDSCDGVMEKIGRSKKLIRYASFDLINKGIKFTVTPRIVGYSAVLALLMAVTTAFMLTRKDMETTILRAKGSMYQVLEDGRIRNMYTAKILNKTFDSMTVHFELENVPGTITVAGADQLLLKPDELVESTFLVDIPPEAVKQNYMKISIGVYRESTLVSSEATSFIAPAKGVRK